MSKLEEAKEILSSLKVPAKQQNGMCCCVLLAMANLTEAEAWGSATNNWIRIHDVIAFANSNYGTTYVHGNFEKLSSLPDNLLFDENAFEQYVEYFSNIQYLICVALFIRFRHIFNIPETIAALEPIISDNLGTLSEIQLLLSPEGVN